MTTASVTDSRPETISGLAISLAFWLTLLMAAALFAAVALSPKLAVYLQLRSQFDANQFKLVSAERQAEHLQRVINAIRNDKDFASELTRVEFDAVRPGEEVLPVDDALELDGRRIIAPTPPPVPIPVWYEPGVRYVASESSLRTSLLASAALLVVVSFAMLQPAGAQQVSSGVRGCHSFWHGILNRYIRQP